MAIRPTRMIRTELDAFSATLARLLIGGFFAISGANNLLNLSQSSTNAAQAGIPAASLMVLVIAILKVILGTLIIIKLHTKTAAMVLIYYVLFSSLIFYNPLKWDTYPQAETIFMRNLAILGGLLFLYAHSRGFALVRDGEVNRMARKKISE